ncbi:MAG TPA: type II secretion system protein GspM [Methylococcaceae bacterium]|jgi:general secretion pathway protein M|nr:type II secretion system protein GspM [Methylococcaceae bacterium]
MALALLFGVLAFLYLVVLMPLLEIGGGYADSIQDLEFRLQRFRKVAAEKDHWLARLEEIKQRGKDKEEFVSGNTAALASADLQTMIKKTVTDAGGELISTQVIPERKEQQFTRIAVKVRMTGSTVVLRDVLYALETGNPILFIENLNLRPIRIGQMRRPGAKAASVPDNLSVDFDVVGYMRAG